MAEVDYQLALLLQHQFEQEARKPKEYAADIELARTLQEQFKTEKEIEAPANGLVYKTKKDPHNSSKCLVDPSWEVIDPTPDIHVLFMSFNDRFFWGTLMAVCVSWSKKMTTCAGICAYQGRGGMCSITLSEPLLKLRPRKDLVETLLHEMIHAHLFVTNNNRDRDGHGPEFHKHMFRINKEAGTNITVYHDFHDEVNLYKQHWWRCDGSCQKRKPYFGMVRRVTNRAPGPNDLWWAEHARNCGGNFIKVKEPEKPVKKSSKENKKPKEDIRKYITPSISPIRADTAVKDIPKPSTSSASTKNATTAANKTPLANVHTFKNENDKTKKVNTVIPKAGNIFGFTNLSGSTTSSKEKGGGTAVKNNSSTIIINKKPSTSTKIETTTADTPVKAQPERILSDNTDYSLVRNHWVNKYPSGNKRAVSVDAEVVSAKIPKLSGSNSTLITVEDEATTECPVCLEKVALSQLNEHLDACLEKPKTKECIICGNKVPVAEFEMHVTKCSEENFDDVFHEPKSSFDQKKCTVCEKYFPVEEFEAHVEKCLLKLYDNIEDEYNSKDERVDCLTCGRSVLKSDLSDHLDDCMGLSQIFKDDDFPEDDNLPVEEILGNSDEGNKYNCPFCMVLVLEKEMCEHIDSCLSTAGSSLQAELNKSVLVSSMLDEDF